MIVRHLQASDLTEILHIEQRAMPVPWTKAQLWEESEVANSVALVAEDNSQLCGYTFFRTCCPECELLHLVVAQEWQRQGVASDLLTQAFADFSNQGYATCFLEVRKSNTAARYLYKKACFRQTGTRKHYYTHPTEDALLMSKDLLDGKQRCQ